MRVADAVVSMALRLSTVGVLAPIGRMVATGEFSAIQAVIALVSGVAVAALLFLAHRLNKNRRER